MPTEIILFLRYISNKNVQTTNEPRLRQSMCDLRLSPHQPSSAMNLNNAPATTPQFHIQNEFLKIREISKPTLSFYLVFKLSSSLALVINYILEQCKSTSHKPYIQLLLRHLGVPPLPLTSKECSISLP